MLKNIEGQTIPSIQFQTRNNDDWVTVTTDDIFANKTVVVFALPGAFTPTCSSSHLPRYDELAPALQAQGVDEIICVSVNDTFVMNAWAEDQGTKNIRFLPDGNGDFSAAMGMLVDKTAIGFGKRSWRYSMLVKNGVIEKMFIEPDLPGDPFEVSDADTMLRYLNPECQTSAITIFSKPTCPYCKKAKAMLEQRGLAYEDLTVGADVTLTMFKAITNADTVPQVFVDGELIGGSEALEAYLTR
ncbi:glutathione peroxidase [Thalassotalea fusca]